MHTWDLARATGQDDTLDPDAGRRAAGRDAADRRDAAGIRSVRSAGPGGRGRTGPGPADGLHRPRPGLAAVTTAAAIVRELHASADPGQYAKVLARVGDPAAVIGVRMRDVFDLARRHPTLELDEIDALLDEPSYEARMVAVSILDLRARDTTAPAEDRRAWAALYLDRHDRLDQWDLVDRAAPRVIGGWLLVSDPAERQVLDRAGRLHRIRTVGGPRSPRPSGWSATARPARRPGHRRPSRRRPRGRWSATRWPWPCARWAGSTRTSGMRSWPRSRDPRLGTGPSGRAQLIDARSADDDVA